MCPDRPVHNLAIDYLRSTDVMFKTTKATTIEVPIDVPVTSEMAVVAVFYVTDYYANGGVYIHSFQADMADIPA